MIKSETINELATALSKAQGEMSAAKKDTTNPFFKSKYADLSSVWEAARGPLSKNGLSVVQTTNPTDGKSVELVTALLHSSGQWITGTMVMIPTKQDPQGLGSCITYMRRYALSAILGISQDDDDANATLTRTAPTPQMHSGLQNFASKPHTQSFDKNRVMAEITEQAIKQIDKNIPIPKHTPSL